MVRDNICRGSHSYVPVIAGPAGNKTERGPGDFMHEKSIASPDTSAFFSFSIENHSDVQGNRVLS